MWCVCVLSITDDIMLTLKTNGSSQGEDQTWADGFPISVPLPTPPPLPYADPSLLFPEFFAITTMEIAFQRTIEVNGEETWSIDSVVVHTDIQPIFCKGSLGGKPRDAFSTCVKDGANVTYQNGACTVAFNSSTVVTYDNRTSPAVVFGWQGRVQTAQDGPGHDDFYVYAPPAANDDNPAVANTGTGSTAGSTTDTNTGALNTTQRRQLMDVDLQGPHFGPRSLGDAVFQLNLTYPRLGVVIITSDYTVVVTKKYDETSKLLQLLGALGGAYGLGCVAFSDTHVLYLQD